MANNDHSTVAISKKDVQKINTAPLNHYDLNEKALRSHNYLISAIKSRSIEQARLVLNAGAVASINVKDGYGHYPLNVSLFYGLSIQPHHLEILLCTIQHSLETLKQYNCS